MSARKPAEARLVDLSHPIESGRPGYPGLPAPRIEPYVSHAASRANYGGHAEFEISRVFMVGNTGTYLDSPYHRYPGEADVADLALDAVAGLSGRLAVARVPPDRSVEIDLGADLQGAAILIETGWDSRWGTDRYWEPGPFVDARLAARLVEAGVALVGVDWWNIDDTADPSRPAHTALLAAGISIVEHLVGLATLRGRSFRFYAVPAPVRGAASFPVRAFAEVID